MTDPVCGMTVDPATARGGSHVYRGTTYYFCSPGCRQKFAADPETYLAKRAPADDPHGHDHHAVKDAAPARPATRPAGESGRAPGGTLWMCPMHPEIVQDRPGSCPIVG